jgi:DNA-binding XRE family transcriptional regulator
MYPTFPKEDLCEICASVKNEEIEKLNRENKELKKIVEFLKNEIRSLELKTALEENAIPLKNIIDEVTSTSEGKHAWEKAWKEQFSEWQNLVEQGKMSKIKYYRLINGIDQRTLAEKLGTSQPNISRIERVGYNVPIKTLKKLAEIFKVKMEALIEK